MRMVASDANGDYLRLVSTFQVSPEVEDDLSKRMAAAGVRESDLEESFVRSGGHGGQNVNKTSTCVMLLHRPSGIQVKCQTTRQQGMNRLLARELLLEKIEQSLKAKADAARDERERNRRRNRPRSRSAKERILAHKAHHSAKKQARRPSFLRD